MARSALLGFQADFGSHHSLGLSRIQWLAWRPMGFSLALGSQFSLGLHAFNGSHDFIGFSRSE
jgi:hypothetical protein